MTDRFVLSGRGLAVTVGEVTDLPVGKLLDAKIIKPDGSAIMTRAYKEWLLRRSLQPREDEAFLLVGLKMCDVPLGSELNVGVAIGRAR